MTFHEFLSHLRGPVLVIVTLVLFAQGQLMLGVFTGWTAYEFLAQDTWLTGKLSALFDGNKDKDTKQ